jgi:KDO2-lipid IV(A) lauroyltransferase
MAFLRLLPRRASLALGGWLGVLAYLLLSKERKITHHNLKTFFSLQNSSQLRFLSRSVFINIGKSAADAVRLPKWREKDFRELVWVEGLTRFDSAYKRGKGLIAVTGHISNFELIAAYFSWLGYKTAVIGREVYDPRLDKLLIKNRTAVDTQNIPTDSSVKVVMQALKDGKALGILVDQNSSRVSNLKVDFFGEKANTPKGPFAIACKLGCPVVPLAIARTKGDYYRIIVGEILEPNEKKSGEESVIDLAQRTNQFLESIIREYPDQWVWMHKRWS